MPYRSDRKGSLEDEELNECSIKFNTNNFPLLVAMKRMSINEIND
ncbi:MAG: hypothetical protein K0S67_190 [Nitrososphaeraceae archaeon]|jgi:hypothetical protein|nr:hypothetical protein [Nitrososphaeraceae archaeon]MCD6036306.1 hypothetical protein [Nitrososphaeraceae archaeon]MDF2767954.1 hypothetical protein [Nitrososphaeraceae archaeon]